MWILWVSLWPSFWFWKANVRFSSSSRLEMGPNCKGSKTMRFLEAGSAEAEAVPGPPGSEEGAERFDILELLESAVGALLDAARVAAAAAAGSELPCLPRLSFS